MSKPHTVIVILEAKPGKKSELKAALESVIEPSRAEKACINYHLYQSKNNANEFVLYENWISAEKHAEQFTKSYIKELGEKAGDLLAKPYQVVLAEEV